MLVNGMPSTLLHLLHICNRSSNSRSIDVQQSGKLTHSNETITVHCGRTALSAQRELCCTDSNHWLTGCLYTWPVHFQLLHFTLCVNHISSRSSYNHSSVSFTIGLYITVFPNITNSRIPCQTPLLICLERTVSSVSTRD